jgi:hypothetical protein
VKVIVVRHPRHQAEVTLVPALPRDELLVETGEVEVEGVCRIGIDDLQVRIGHRELAEA